MNYLSTEMLKGDLHLQFHALRKGHEKSNQAYLKKPLIDDKINGLLDTTD